MSTRLTRHLRVLLALILCLLILSLPVRIAHVSSQSPTRLILITVVDGLRPDSINREDTPTLFRLRAEGVNYINSHSIFPTVTRVNAAALSTGCYPDRNGLVSNSMYVPAVNPMRAFNTGDYRQLLKMRDATGRLLLVPSLAERLSEHGIRFAAVSSGSTGSALLLNPRAAEGVGILVNGNFDPGKRVAYPDEANTAILSRFGPAPLEEGSSSVDWADRVLREYVLPELKPDVVIDWQTEPDGAQHRYGAGSPEARKALSNSDRNLGLTLAKLKELGLADKTDVIVLSDHGFSLNTHRVNATQSLIKAGLKTSADSEDVVLASNGQSVLVHVKGRDRARIEKIVRFLQSEDWVDVIFTSARSETSQGGGVQADKKRNSTRGGRVTTWASASEPAPRDATRRGVSARDAAGDHLGWVSGTFSLELIHLANPERGPDILFTLPWSSAPNSFGVAGTHYIDGDGNPGPLTGTASGHGGISPWLVRNTLVLWGPDFKRGITIRLPAANVDISPTVLALTSGRSSNSTSNASLDGRALSESFRSGSHKRQSVRRTTFSTGRPGRQSRAIQTTLLGTFRYIDGVL